MANDELNGIDLTIPRFLVREKRLTPEQVSQLANRQTDWAPFRDYKNQPPKPLDPIFVTNPSAPVVVLAIKTRFEKAEPGKKPAKVQEVRTMSTYADMAEFGAKHDRRAYPVKMHRSNKDQTVIWVTGVPWADKVAESDGTSTPRAPRAPRKAGQLGPKAQMVADLLMRPEGCTSKDVLRATGWPAVSMPQQAKIAGLELRKEKQAEGMRYWGSVGGVKAEIAPHGQDSGGAVEEKAETPAVAIDPVPAPKAKQVSRKVVGAKKRGKK